jgi:hypothetical protein
MAQVAHLHVVAAFFKLSVVASAPRTSIRGGHFYFHLKL